MTREEAIKHLSEWMDEKMWMCFGTIDREAIGMAIEALSTKTDWIPCSEGLPSEIGTIIVTLLDKKYGECFVDDEWWDGDMFLNFGKPTSGYEVIAWMPYPMPYRKGDER